MLSVAFLRPLENVLSSAGGSGKTQHSVYAHLAGSPHYEIFIWSAANRFNSPYDYPGQGDGLPLRAPEW